MRSTSVDYLNKIYANSTYTKKEKQRLGSVQKKMMKNNWKMSHVREKHTQAPLSPMLASQSQTNFKIKDRFTHSHGSGGFYRECISTGTHFFNGQDPAGSAGSQWSQMMAGNTNTQPDEDKIN